MFNLRVPGCDGFTNSIRIICLNEIFAGCCYFSTPGADINALVWAALLSSELDADTTVLRLLGCYCVDDDSRVSLG